MMFYLSDGYQLKR